MIEQAGSSARAGALLYRTVANLERRWRPAAMVIVAGLVVLMFHLVFFPWPDIFFRA